MQKKYGIATGVLLLSAHVAQAAEDRKGWKQFTSGETYNTSSDLQATLTNVINWILGFIALVAVLMIIFGGVQYLTSAGNVDTAKKGKDTITRAVMGLVIAGLAYAIVNLVINQIK